MKQLFTSLYGYYKSRPELVTAITDFYLESAPAEAVFPYVVCKLVSSTMDHTYTEKFENYLIQLDIYEDSNSPKRSAELWDLLIQALDFWTGVIENYILISTIREGTSMSQWEVEGKKVWDVTLNYRILLQYN